MNRREFLKVAAMGSVGSVMGWLTCRDILPYDQNSRESNVSFLEIAFLKEEEPSGNEALKRLGLAGKIIYIVYGRPSKAGEKTWGSLGLTQTAEESWQLVQQMETSIASKINTTKDNFALRILNPVYSSGNGPLSDKYVEQALNLASKNKGLVALSFNNLIEPLAVIQKLAKTFPPYLLAHLGVSLDVEFFLSQRVDALALNKFTAWFAQKHREWAGKEKIPGMVLVYTFHSSAGISKIDNLGKLQQYYPREDTFMPIIFDGYGSISAKSVKMESLMMSLPDEEDAKPLVGAMEFQSRWGGKYDQASVGETFSLISGPATFLASQ